jgi:hypothetical protein
MNINHPEPRLAKKRASAIGLALARVRAALADPNNKRQNMKTTKLLAGALALNVWTHAPAQNLIVNGDFESPLIAPNTAQHDTPDSWTWESAVGFIFNGSYGVIWPLPPSGLQFLDLGNEPTYALSQSVTFASGGQYRLEWLDNTASWVGYNSPYSVSLLANSLQPVFQANFDAAHRFTWRTNSFLLNLPPGTYTLRFQALGFFNGLDTLIDNVSLTVVVGDGDGDGVLDDQDECPDTSPGAIVNEHGCSIDQLVPCYGPASGGVWKNHGQYVSATANAVEAFLGAGRITEQEAQAVIVAAARSNCGKK